MAHHALSVKRRNLRRRRDLVIHAAGVVIVYDWPDGNDATTALVISAWRE
jgi:hypothetical protein